MSLFVLALFLLLPSPSSQAQRLAPHELVEKVSDRYGRLDSLSADFEQIQKGPNRTPPSRGHVYLKKGRKARFDYDSPRKIDYFDGKTRTHYVPDERQAISEPMGKSEDERLLIFLILGNRESPWKDEFGRKEEGPRNPPMFPGNRVVILVPNNKKNIQEVLVEVDPATFLIHRFAFTRSDKAYTEYIFKNIDTTPLPDSLFKFTAPPGVDHFLK